MPAPSSPSETLPEPAARFGFAPDAARAASLDAAVRQGLADSLAIIFDSLDPPRSDEERCAALLRRIRAGPVPPGLFGVYVELVLALFDGREDDAEALVADLRRPQPAPSEALRLVTLDDHDLGPGQSARYRRLLSEDIVCPIEPLTPGQRALAATQLTEAMDLLRAGAPETFAEFRALVREIVLVTPGEGAHARAFGGASAFSLWGALVLNANGLGERLEAAVQLAHESAHTHLFGLARGGPLVANDDDERYPSPLRQDLRPMEGVVHATYVTARMIHALQALLASGALSPGETARARDQLAQNAQVYEEGLKTVLAHARLTEAGTAAIEGLRRHMDGAP